MTEAVLSPATGGIAGDGDMIGSIEKEIRKKREDPFKFARPGGGLWERQIHRKPPDPKPKNNGNEVRHRTRIKI